MAERNIRKAGFPVVTTDCDEIDAIAEIILRCEPDIFAAGGHAQRVTRKRIGGNNNCIQTDTRRCRASRHTTRRKQGCLASGQKASGPSHGWGKYGGSKDAGLPDKRRRDPHTPRESPALQKARDPQTARESPALHLRLVGKGVAEAGDIVEEALGVQIEQVGSMLGVLLKHHAQALGKGQRTGGAICQ